MPRGAVVNLGGKFSASEDTADVVAGARSAMADLLNSHPDEIVFGQNMTSLTFACSRALARTWKPSANIILSRADHEANVSPWLLAAADRGVSVRWVDVDPEEGCSLDMASLEDALNGNTALVAFTHASNATGTITDVERAVRLAQSAGARTYVDAVHYAPHAIIDVAATGTDFLACSAYKFYGPHVGVMYGKMEALEAIAPYKLRPAPERPPGRWETGTQSFEALAGVTAAVDYIAGLASAHEGPRRARLCKAFELVADHERDLSTRFLDRVHSMPSVRVHGKQTAQGRTATFALDIEGADAHDVAAFLGARGVFVWSGSYYAVETMARLGVGPSGLVRVGFVHYNSEEEVERVLDDIDSYLKTRC